MARKAGKGIEYTITGVKEIRNAYRLLPKKVANKVVRQSIRQALKPMLSHAKRTAPKGETGMLRKKIKIRTRAKKRRGTIALDARVGEGDFKGETYYAAMVNFGTSMQPAQHFMERSFDATKGKAETDVKEFIKQGTIEEWKKL